MQRLWIVTELFPPDETSTSYILGEIANAMTKKYEVKVIAGPEVYDKRKKTDLAHPFNLNEQIEVKRVNGADLDKNTLKGKSLSFLLMSKRLYALAKANIRNNDKVLMVTNPAPLVLLMCRLKQKRGFELNILVHDVFPENTKPAGYKLPFYSAVKRLFDKAYSKADLLIAIGRDMKEVLKNKTARYSNYHSKIKIIENWADTDTIFIQEMPKGNLILEYAGNIGRVQGLDKIMSEIPSNMELHIYGTGSMEETLKKEKHDNVFFHGAYLRSEQNKVLAACHIALVTLQDGMYGLGVPSKTYNIMASGRPVLYFGPQNSEIYRLIQEEDIGYCGWPEKWDIKELERKGKKAREVAVKKYSKRIILDKFLKEI